MKNRDFLQWLHARLVHVYHESPNEDFMHKLRAIIRDTPPDRDTPIDACNKRTGENRPSYRFERPDSFSAKQIALAEKIANDINEGTGGQETLNDLRMAVSYWADVATTEARKRATIEADLAVFVAAKDIFDALVEKSATANKKARKTA